MANHHLATRMKLLSCAVIGIVTASIGVGFVVAGPGQVKGSGGGTQNTGTTGKTANPGSGGTKTPQKPAPFGDNLMVARVNGEVIMYKALAEECVARKGTAVLETMIFKQLLTQECKKKGIAVSAQEVEDEITRHAMSLKLSRSEYFQAAEKELGLAPPAFAQDKVWPALALRKLAAPSVEITEEDIRRGFEAQHGERRNCRWITLDNLQGAMRVWDELRKSSKNDDGKIDLTEFERQVLRWSTDYATRTSGGKLQPISRHNSPALQALESAAFAMQENGEISKVVQLGNQYAILYRESRIPPDEKQLEDVRGEIKAYVYETKLADQMGRIMVELQEKATIENHLTGDVSIPKTAGSAAEKGMKPQDDSAKVSSNRDAAKKGPAATRK